MATSPLEQNLERVLFSAEDIQQRIAELGEQISADYTEGELLLIGVLKGGVYFLSDLSRAIGRPHEIAFVGTSSYGSGTTSSGEVVLTHELSGPIRGRHVILCEDIYDTGGTLQYLLPLLKNGEPKSLTICSLLYKNRPREIELEIKYVGFECEDVFVVGYGLDYAELYRNLGCIGVLKPEIYQDSGEE